MLITDPQHVGPKDYRMLLSVDDDCEIMSDHVSGHHLQGMVLIEAARQAFLAVTERFLLPDTGKYYFAINKFDVTYLKFVFPLPTEIHFELLEADDSRSERLSASAKIAFYQAGERVCEVDVSYMAIVETILSAKEKKLAQGILSQIRSNAMRQSAEGALVA
ncbi:AfsA-related hotdog domain-containing protein [Undibacterium arcticum]|uniref:AfsA-related hotdog domain-containing protein n=1 Tax=Undibacterium arcticum TaxID=1762892 RepID=UPI003611158E